MGLSRVGSAPQLQSLIDATPGDATPPAVPSPTNAASYTGSTSRGTPVNVVKPCALALPPPSAREQKWTLRQAQKILTEQDVCMCPVSLTTYDYPVILQCGHSLDEAAAKIIQQANPRLPCPECRREAPPGAPAYAPNFALMDVMQKLGFPSRTANVSFFPKEQLLRAFNQGDADAALALLRQMLPVTRQAATNAFNNTLTAVGETPLYLAAWNGMYEIVEFLLNEGADVNQGRTDRGATPLIVAAENGHKNVVAALLQKEDINVNQGTTDEGATPLLVAAENGHMDIVTALLQKEDINVNQGTTDEGATPLFVAAENGHMDIVTALLQKEDINVNQGTTDEGATPLLVAAENGHMDIVTALLQKEDINVNQGTTDEGATPLYIAAQNGHMDVVVALLEKGADVKQGRTDYGDTPLQTAKRNGHWDIVKCLEGSYRRPGGCAAAAVVETRRF